MTFIYGLTGDINKITQVTDPFGRSAIFDYYPTGQLKSITDPVGIVSQIEYQTGTNFINKLTTPYGDAIFATGGSGTNRWLNMTDPRGATERVEYRYATAGISPTDPTATVPSGSEFVNANLHLRNSFYWDKKAVSLYPPVDGVYDYTKAKITHWLRTSDGTLTSGIVASEKMPLENRVWHIYPEQPDDSRIGPKAQPAQVARVLDDGSTQRFRYEYNNSLGNTTKSTDPRDRVTSFEYYPGDIDVRFIYQRHPATGNDPGGASTDPDGLPADKIASYGTYNSLHAPLTATDAAGQTTNYTYNSHGQKTDVQNARGETTHYEYGSDNTTCSDVPNGYLISVTSPPFNGPSAVTTLHYDCARRMHTVTTSPDDYTVTTEYDALDRPTLITYPDGTTRQLKYTEYTDQGVDTGKKLLDLTQEKDRLNRWTYRHYDGNRRMEWIKDPLDRKTTFGWCICGSLSSITDPNLNVTTFNRDLQSRVTSKVFGDGAPNSTTVNYAYEDTTSRLKAMTDALGQSTHYQYFPDNDIQQLSYTNAHNPTPAVTYAYDPNYNRVSSMITAGIGTTNYTYYPIASPPTVNANKLATVGGLFPNDTITYQYDELGQAVSQSINGVSASMHYDSLGRMDTSDNPLGHFSRVYESVTRRLQTFSYPNGQMANYVYFGNDHDRRLQTLQNLTSSGSVNLSRFDYTYDSEGAIQSLNKTLGTNQNNLAFGYDPAQQLTSVTQGNIHFEYEYDDAGNRLTDVFSAQFSHGGNTYTANSLNQLGSVTNDPGVGPILGPFPLTYDANGNMTLDAAHKAYEWDAANRVIAINYTDTGKRTEFAYDGLSRRVKITEYGPGVTAVAQPADGKYTTFTSASFTLPSGGYSLTFQGLNPNGGDNTALVDSVALNSTLVAHGSFENPSVTDYQTNPADTAWSYTGSAGVAANGGTYTSGNPDAPLGTQVAFVRNDGLLTQIWSATAGTYTLSFEAAQRDSGNDSYQQLRVNLRPSGSAISAKTFLWCGNEICEERDSAGAVVKKRFFAEGEQRIGGSDAGNYYYSRDHLGSIREVTNSSGTLRAQYDYDAWGNSVVVSSRMTVDFGYTGHYFHQPSGLNLTLYRAYSPTLGRWLSRDPIGEMGGINLYGYVGNNPSNCVDQLGLSATTLFFPFGFSVSFHDPFTSHDPGEMEHERQHRYDWANNSSLPGWKMEQRAWAAQAAFIRRRIAELRGKQCLTDAEKKELITYEEALPTAERLANSEAESKEYYNRTQPWWRRE